jgi:hypothetical protein
VSRGYAEGPALEEAERRLDQPERELEAAPERLAVYGATEDEPEPHLIGWVPEVDPDELFRSGRAWGLTLVRRRPSQPERARGG